MSEQPYHLQANANGNRSAEISEADSHYHKNLAEEREESADLEELQSSDEEDQDHSADGAASEEDTESNFREDALVSIVTADFAMQNVILQLGLQLVSPDGRRIRRISRWALRCSACFKVTKVSSSPLPAYLRQRSLPHPVEVQRTNYIPD